MIPLTEIVESLRAAIFKRLPTVASRNAFAGQIGIHRTYMAMIRSGQNSPVGLMLRMADELGIQVSVTIDGRDLQRNPKFTRREIERSDALV